MRARTRRYFCDLLLCIQRDYRFSLASISVHYISCVYHGFRQNLLTANVKIECNGIETAPPVSFHSVVVANGASVLALAASKLPEEPLQAVRPIDQVEMAHTNQRAFVVTPPTRLDAALVVS